MQFKLPKINLKAPKVFRKVILFLGAPTVIVLLAGLLFSTWLSLNRIENELEYNSVLRKSIMQNISRIQKKAQELENEQKRIAEENNKEEDVEIRYITSKSIPETTTPKPKPEPEPEPEPETEPESIETYCYFGTSVCTTF